MEITVRLLNDDVIWVKPNMVNLNMKKQNNSLERQPILTEIAMLCWNLPSNPKHQGSLKKTMSFSEGNQLFASDFHANLDETNTFIWFNLQRNGTGKGNLTSRALLQKASSYKCQFSTKVSASSRLVSQVYMMAGQNIKKKYLMCLISIKILKQHGKPNSIDIWNKENQKLYHTCSNKYSLF